jgi:hypothetical protein
MDDTAWPWHHVFNFVASFFLDQANAAAATNPTASTTPAQFVGVAVVGMTLLKNPLLQPHGT